MAWHLWRNGCRSGASNYSVRRDRVLDAFPETNRTLRIEGSAMTETERPLSSPSSFMGWNVLGYNNCLTPPEEGRSMGDSIHGYP